MLTRFPGVFLLALALTRPALPQTSPDIQKVLDRLDRLDRLEDENRKLLDEIRALRNELQQCGGKVIMSPLGKVEMSP